METETSLNNGLKKTIEWVKIFHIIQILILYKDTIKCK